MFSATGAVALPAEPGSGRGRSHGTSSSEPFDRWFRYPAGFASDYVGMLLDRLDLDGGTLLDCFAGSGVSGTAARQRGFDFIGVEAHPLIAELARLKLMPTADGPQIQGAAEAAVTAAKQLGSVDIDEEPGLILRSFSPRILRDLVALREAIVDRFDEPSAAYLKWALLGTLRDVAQVKVGWPYQRPGSARRPRSTDVAGRFVTRAKMMAADLKGLPDHRTEATIVVGDSADPAIWPERTAQSCVSSPPYLNNFDYADATRLETYFWGAARSWADMCSTIRSNMLTSTTQQSSVRERDDALRTVANTTIGSEVATLTDRLQGERRQRRRGKEYDQVVPAYFAAMNAIIGNVARALTPGAPCVWLIGDSAPYGVHIDTPRLIGELAEGAGFTVTEDVVLRRRGARWGTATGRHDVQLSERLLLFYRNRPDDSSQAPAARTKARWGTAVAAS